MATLIRVGIELTTLLWLIRHAERSVTTPMAYGNVTWGVTLYTLAAAIGIEGGIVAGALGLAMGGHNLTEVNLGVWITVATALQAGACVWTGMLVIEHTRRAVAGSKGLTDEQRRARMAAAIVPPQWPEPIQLTTARRYAQSKRLQAAIMGSGWALGSATGLAVVAASMGIAGGWQIETAMAGAAAAAISVAMYQCGYTAERSSEIARNRQGTDGRTVGQRQAR